MEFLRETFPDEKGMSTKNKVAEMKYLIEQLSTLQTKSLVQFYLEVLGAAKPKHVSITKILLVDQTCANTKNYPLKKKNKLLMDQIGE